MQKSSFTKRKRSAQDGGWRVYLGGHFPAFPKSQAAEVGSERRAYRRRKPQHWGAVVQYKQPANQTGYWQAGSSTLRQEKLSLSGRILEIGMRPEKAFVTSWKIGEKS